jgi:glyoxylase-like metal-dependent hydrolase (beta-lactamase superfamily II)
MTDFGLTRRHFLADLGRGAFAVAILGIAGCGSGPTPNPSGRSSATAPSGPPASGPGGSTAGSPAPTSAASGSPGGPGAPGGVAWSRVNLGFVSAYLLVRDGEGAIVDTGVAGSAGAIEAAMAAVGLAWSDVGNVILTHRHPDHAGSIDDLLAAAPEAAGWIGAADLGAIATTRPLGPVADGDEVFGLRIVATPGHTAGHIAVLDEVGGLLVAGDALSTVGGPLAGSNPQFTEDAVAARASIVKLGKLTFETLLVGHGEPILAGAAAQVKALGGG